MTERESATKADNNAVTQVDPSLASVIFESERLLVLNKNADVSLLADRTGAPELWSHLKENLPKPYLVHRLDKGTSGVLVVAKDQATQTTLTKSFEAHAVRKFYVARVLGHFPIKLTHRIELPLCKGRKSRYRVAAPRETIAQVGTSFSAVADREGVAALTYARTLSQGEDYSDLCLLPITGRTHQLRVHLSWLGYPILGDHLYGSEANRGGRLRLHCHKLYVPGVGVFHAPVPW